LARFGLRGFGLRFQSFAKFAALTTMDNILGATLARERFSSVLLTGFAAISMLLAALGIFGVLNYLVGTLGRARRSYGGGRAGIENHRRGGVGRDAVR
jgi:hypothetical protein